MLLDHVALSPYPFYGHIELSHESFLFFFSFKGVVSHGGEFLKGKYVAYASMTIGLQLSSASLLGLSYEEIACTNELKLLTYGLHDSESLNESF